MEHDDIADRMQSLHLTAAESIRCRVARLNPTTDEVNRTVICKLLIPRDVPIHNLRGGLEKSWKTSSFRVEKLRPDVVQVLFDKRHDSDFALSGGPWCFDNYLIITKLWQKGWATKPNFFGSEYFWIIVSGLPSTVCTPEVGRQLLSLLGSGKEGQIREEPRTGTRFFRFRVQVDVTSSLRRFICLDDDEGEELIGKVKYERLPFICFRCGKLYHTVSYCPMVKQEPTREQLQRMPYRAEELSCGGKSTLISTFIRDAKPGPLLLEYLSVEHVNVEKKLEAPLDGEGGSHIKEVCSHIKEGIITLSNNAEIFENGDDGAMELEPNVVNKGADFEAHCSELASTLGEHIDRPLVQLPSRSDGTVQEKKHWKRLARKCDGASTMIGDSTIGFKRDFNIVVHGKLDTGGARDLNTDGETASKKSRHTEPLVESAELQAHPAL